MSDIFCPPEARRGNSRFKVYPMFPITAGNDDRLLQRLVRTEAVLACSLDVIQVLLQRLAAAEPDGVVDDRLKAFMSSGSPQDVDLLVNHVSSRMQLGDTGGAARELHDRLGWTWDEALACVRHPAEIRRRRDEIRQCLILRTYEITFRRSPASHKPLPPV